MTSMSRPFVSELSCHPEGRWVHELGMLALLVVFWCHGSCLGGSQGVHCLAERGWQQEGRARGSDGTAQLPGSGSSGDAGLLNQLLRSHLLQDNLVREATNATKLCLVIKASEDQEAVRPRKVFLFAAVVDRLMQQYGDGAMKTALEYFKEMDPEDLDLFLACERAVLVCLSGG